MMIRKIPLFIACALCGVLAAPATAGDLPAAEDLLARSTAAIGGDAIKDVKNMAAEFSFSMPAMGLSTTGESYIERPDKTYSMISLAAMGSADFESGVNGDIVWQNNPQEGLLLLGGNERRMAIRGSWLDPFARWRDLWDTAQTVAEEIVAGAACYKVVLTPADADPMTAWFDKETGLLVQEELPVPEMGSSVVTKFSDYREVGGVKQAHRIEQEGLVAFTIEYTDVRYNTDDIPADIFEVPQGIKEMAGQ